jgi:hypothetical protein
MMPEHEADQPARRRVRLGVLALAAVLVVMAFAARIFFWFYNEEGADRRKTPAVESPAGDPIDWETNAKRFEAEKVQAASILEGADKVEPFRIEVPFESHGLDYTIVSRAHPLGHHFAKHLAAVLLNPKSYSIPGQDGKLCIFDPHVAFRVWKGADFVDVLICFECMQLMVVENDPAVPERSLGAKLARFRVGGDFDPVTGTIAQLAREAFPGDPSLQEVFPEWLRDKATTGGRSGS